MKLFFDHLHSELELLYPETEIQSFGYLIAENIAGLSKTEILTNKNTVFSDEQRHQSITFIQKLKTHVPIQYILGETEFFGLSFLVNEAVLIPRPETEELIEWVQISNSKNLTANILDIGTGSGCIAITLKHIFPQSNVTAIDISDKALLVAKSNAKKNNTNIDFKQVDILNPVLLVGKWDIIISNPPYIPEMEKAEILPNVLNHEPHLALFVTNHDPLLFYRQIALFAKNNLQKGGQLYFEIHRNEGQSCVALLHELGFKNIELRKDLSRNDRMIKAEN